jgi:hypothetical protein
MTQGEMNGRGKVNTPTVAANPRNEPSPSTKRMKWKHNKNTGSALPHMKKVVEWTRSIEIKLTPPENETLDPGRSRRQHAKGNETKQNHTNQRKHINKQKEQRADPTHRQTCRRGQRLPRKPRVASRRRNRASPVAVRSRASRVASCRRPPPRKRERQMGNGK